VSPSDLGQLLKPFVFLDLLNAPPNSFGGVGLHRHSGIATLTVLLQGATRYEDTKGQPGVLPQGGLEWMQAGGGVWHTGSALLGRHNRGFQLWVALPPTLENATPLSQDIPPERIEAEGPTRVLLGHLGAARSAITPHHRCSSFWWCWARVKFGATSRSRNIPWRGWQYMPEPSRFRPLWRAEIWPYSRRHKRQSTFIPTRVARSSLALRSATPMIW